ncbi:unnamed protein product [Rhizophagus irregularis]|nr:unnamed protein product [Rhizophagus irregularis]
MKTERANRYQYSKPLNSELTSDDANTSSSTETQMSILEDNEYNTDNSTEIQIPIEDSLSGTTSEHDHVIYDLDNSFENSSDELLSRSSSSMMSYDEVSSDSSSVTDILQQEYDISESLLSALRFLKVKIEHNLTDEAFQETMMAFNSNPISLHTVKKQLKSIVHIEPIWIDMCLNSCCAYTESYRKLTKCPVCGSERFQHKKPCKQYSYFSLIERHTIQYRNYDRAKELRYRTNYTSQKLYKCNIQIGDVFDGDHYKELYTTYDIFALPNRTHEEWQQRLEKIHKSKVGKMRDTLVNKYAEEWAGWITMYSLPLLKDYLPTKYYKGWSFFVQAVQLCQKKVITMDELNNIDTLLLKFYVHYEREYYKFSANRLSAMKMCIHYILHVVASIKRNGPCCTTWQFPIERVCGMLLPLARSRLHPYKNITNNVYIIELFNHLRFYKLVYQKLLPEKTIKEYHGLVFTTDSYEEVFYSPMQQYTLKRSEIKKIKEHYSTYYDVRARQLQSFDSQGLKFSRLLTRNGYYIGSNWIRRNETWARVNYSVLVYLEVDIYSNNQRRTPVFEKRPFYGNIEYYLMYEFNNEKSMLAYINWTASVSTDSVGLKYFTKFAVYDFIDVIAVERCVGFIKVDNKYYIVDKEANNTIM